jgi:hypothetical protein
MNIGEYPEWQHTGPGSPYYDDTFDMLDDMTKEELDDKLFLINMSLDEMAGKKYYRMRDIADEITARLAEYDNYGDA